MSHIDRLNQIIERNPGKYAIFVLVFIMLSLGIVGEMELEEPENIVEARR